MMFGLPFRSFFVRKWNCYWRCAQVDYFTMDEAMKICPDASQIKVIIPARLESYMKDRFANWCLVPVTKKDTSNLGELLRKIKEVNPEALIEMLYDTITIDDYFLRDSEEVKNSDEVYAFQVNDSLGTWGTINKASGAGLPISLYKKYTI